MFTQFITLTTKEDGKIWTVALPVSNIALMEERGTFTIITLVNGGKIVVNELIEQILAKIDDDDDDEEDYDDESDDNEWDDGFGG